MKKYGIKSRTIKESFEVLKSKGWEYPKEAREQIKKAHLGKVVSEETKRKMSISDKVGGIGHKKKRKDGIYLYIFPDHPNSTKDGDTLWNIFL